MASPVFYQTLNMVGVDPTIFYVDIWTPGASIDPVYPAAPFIPGTQAFGSDGSQFVFVQASTSISLTDFVIIGAGTTPNPYMANSVTSTVVTPSLAPSPPIALAATGLILKQSVSYIPAGAMFWACTKGNFIPASNSYVGGLATGNVALYTTTTAGALATSSVTSDGAQFSGITVISSLSISIAASVVPAGLGATQSNGYTVGPVVALNNPQPTFTASTTVTGFYW